MKTFIQTILFIFLMLVLTWAYAQAGARLNNRFYLSAAGALAKGADGEISGGTLCFNQAINESDGCDGYILMD